MWGGMYPDGNGKMGNLFSNTSTALLWKVTIQMLLSHFKDLVPVLVWYLGY